MVREEVGRAEFSGVANKLRIGNDVPRGYHPFLLHNRLEEVHAHGKRA